MGNRARIPVEACLLALLAGLVAFGLYSFPRHPLGLPDLAGQGGYDYFHYFATTRALEAGLPDVYRSEEMERFSLQLSGGRWAIRDNHPLPFYLLYQGLARMEFGPGYLAHLWLGVGLYAAGVLALCLFMLPGRRVALGVAALLAAASLVTGPGVDNLWLGQVGFALAFCLALTFVLGASGREATAGVFLALAVLLKLYPALLAGYYLRRGQGRVVASMACTLGFVGILAGLEWGFGHYANYLAWSGETAYKSVLSNQSLMGLAALLLGEDAGAALKLLNLLLVAAASAGLFLAGRRWGGPSREARLLEFSAWLLVSMILAPLSWAHHHVALVLPLVGFAALALRGPQHEAFGLAGVALMVLLGSLEGEVVTREWVRAVHFQACQWRVVLALLGAVLGACVVGMARTRDLPGEGPGPRAGAMPRPAGGPDLKPRAGA